MVDLLVDACVRAKEVTRAAAVASSGALPRAGRDLVPYFNPGSTDWGLEDVNGNVEDSDSSDDSVRYVVQDFGPNGVIGVAQLGVFWRCGVTSEVRPRSVCH